MSEWAIIASTTLVTFGAVLVCSLYGFRHGNDLSLIDGYYGFATLVHVTLTFALHGEVTARGALVTAVSAAWSLGLGLHMAGRWWRRERYHGGDVRYRQTAERLGLGESQASTRLYRTRMFLVVALPQVLLIAVLNLPIQFAVMTTGQAFGALDGIGLAVMALGGTMEVTANWQLERFKATRSPGQTLMSGWWRCSRHPNYYGNTLVYAGAFLVATADPTRWWTIASPITILLVLRFVLGVRMTDALMLEKRAHDDDYLRYVEQTPAFVALPAVLRRARVTWRRR